MIGRDVRISTGLQPCRFGAAGTMQLGLPIRQSLWTKLFRRRALLKHMVESVIACYLRYRVHRSFVGSPSGYDSKKDIWMKRCGRRWVEPLRFILDNQHISQKVLGGCFGGFRKSSSRHSSRLLEQSGAFSLHLVRRRWNLKDFTGMGSLWLRDIAGGWQLWGDGVSYSCRGHVIWEAENCCAWAYNESGTGSSSVAAARYNRNVGGNCWVVVLNGEDWWLKMLRMAG